MDPGASSCDAAVDLAEYGAEEDMSVSGQSSKCSHSEENSDASDSSSSESDDISSNVSGNEEPSLEDMPDASEANPVPASSGNEKPALADMADASESELLLAIQSSGHTEADASSLESDGEEWECMSEVRDSPEVGDVQLGESRKPGKFCEA